MDDGAEHKQTCSEAPRQLCVSVCVLSCPAARMTNAQEACSTCSVIQGDVKEPGRKGTLMGAVVFLIPDPSFPRNPFKIKLRKNKSELVPLIVSV